MIAAIPSSTSCPTFALRLPENDHDHAGEGSNRAQRPSAAADLLAEEQARQQQRDQRRDEGQRDRLSQRHPADAPEEQGRHDRDDHARQTWIVSVLRLAMAAPRQVKGCAE